MRKYLIIIITFIGLIGILSGCEKDETKIVFSSNPVAPAITTLPDLNLKRTDGTKIIEFTGTPVNPGFKASANYFLEACATGNNFVNAVTVFSGIQDTSIKMTVSDLNGILLKKFPADQISSVDFRIRAILVVDAGTGAPGTGTDPFEYSSEVKNANVTIYGLPRLDLLESGITQKIESALGDGKYFGYVKLDATKPFTLKDPDSNTVYGADGTALAVNGTGITAANSGWYKFNADTQALTFSMESYMIGLVGSATPNGWNAPDQKMDYDSSTGTWYITIDLVAGDIKFRLNDGWAWNLGGTPDNLVHNGDNITVAAGNYTIRLTITTALPVGSEAGTYTIVKN